MKQVQLTVSAKESEQYQTLGLTESMFLVKARINFHGFNLNNKSDVLELLELQSASQKSQRDDIKWHKARRIWLKLPPFRSATSTKAQP